MKKLIKKYQQGGKSNFWKNYWNTFLEGIARESDNTGHTSINSPSAKQLDSNTSKIGTDIITDFTPIVSDIKDIYRISKDVKNKNYSQAAIGIGLLALPNFIEKPAKLVKKGVNRVIKGADIDYLKAHNIETSKNRKENSFNQAVIKDMEKQGIDPSYVSKSPYSSIFKEIHPEYTTDYYIKEYNRVVNAAKSSLKEDQDVRQVLRDYPLLYDIAQTSPNYAGQIYQDIKKGIVDKVGLKLYVQNLVNQSNTLLRGMYTRDKDLTSKDFLTIRGGGMDFDPNNPNTYSIHTGNPGVVNGWSTGYGDSFDKYGIYTLKNKIQLKGDPSNWWQQRIVSFNNPNVKISNGMHNWNSAARGLQVESGIIDSSDVYFNYLDKNNLNNTLFVKDPKVDGHLVINGPKGYNIGDVFNADVIKKWDFSDPPSELVKQLKYNPSFVRFTLGYKCGGKIKKKLIKRK